MLKRTIIHLIHTLFTLFLISSLTLLLFYISINLRKNFEELRSTILILVLSVSLSILLLSGIKFYVFYLILNFISILIGNKRIKRVKIDDEYNLKSINL